MAKSRRRNFSEMQKAQIFVRDRATCAFSGEGLWILDYGASPDFRVDWVDHIIPCAHGGCATLENAICTDGFYNYAKGHNAKANHYLFKYGKPTSDFYRLYDAVPNDIVTNLQRFISLHYSDWFFNRSLFRLIAGIAFLSGLAWTVKRDDQYYAVASYKAMSRWKTIVQKEDVMSLEKRGLVPPSPSTDQELMLSIREASKQDDVHDLMNQLLPFFKRNQDVLESIATLSTPEEALALYWDAVKSKYVEHIRKAIQEKGGTLGIMRWPLPARKR